MAVPRARVIMAVDQGRGMGKSTSRASTTKKTPVETLPHQLAVITSPARRIRMAPPRTQSGHHIEMPGDPAVQNIGEEGQGVDKGGPGMGVGIREKIDPGEYRHQHQPEGGEKIGKVHGHTTLC